MTLNRNLDSSLDPALAGRPGDVLLGGGFEIVYVMSDILDLDDGASDNCLAVTQEVVWFRANLRAISSTCSRLKTKFFPSSNT